MTQIELGSVTLEFGEQLQAWWKGKKGKEKMGGVV